MKEEDVPQTGLDFKERDTVRKLIYATGKDGSYTGVPSVGWEAENIATKDAWDAIDEELQDVATRLRNGETSPIELFMHRSLMDLGILAKYAGKWQWQVKRHMKPAVFAKLSEKMLCRYAEVFQISLEELMSPVVGR